MEKRKAAAVRRKLRDLFKVLADRKKILIISHDNPDPDTLASALALRNLIQKKLGAEVTIGFTGIIGRAENRAMINYLSIPLKKLDELDRSKFDATVMVDSQQHTARLSISEEFVPDAIIDHHPLRPESRKVSFRDVQSRMGATSTIITEYYMVDNVELDSRLATALLYGVKSDTRDLGRETSKYDLEAYLYLYPRANLKLLAQIECAEVPVDYFRVYDRCIDKAVLFDGAVVSFIGDIDNPDMVAELADTLIRLENSRCALVGAYYDNQFFVSVRTKDADVNAGKLVQRLIGKLGSSGGHGSMSAGRIKIESMSDREKATIEKTIIKRLKHAMKIKDRRGKKLVN